MARPATTKLKCNSPVGQLPVLQYCAPEQLLIDEAYQRSLEAGASQALIRRIAVHWDWGLCQPLFVARRGDGGLYVVDGQHRLVAARLRGDIWQLPCVVTSFANAEDEAAAFVALNQQRRPLTQLDLFKAALAAGDFEASQIAIALKDAGVGLANTTNNVAMKPAQVANVAGLKHCYRIHGIQVLNAALQVLSKGFEGQVLRYAGTLFVGITSIIAIEVSSNPDFIGGETFDLMVEMVGGASQAEWMSDIALVQAAGEAASKKVAAELVFKKAWAECTEAMLDEAA